MRSCLRFLYELDLRLVVHNELQFFTEIDQTLSPLIGEVQHDILNRDDNDQNRAVDGELVHARQIASGWHRIENNNLINVEAEHNGQSQRQSALERHGVHDERHKTESDKHGDDQDEIEEEEGGLSRHLHLERDLRTACAISARIRIAAEYVRPRIFSGCRKHVPDGVPRLVWVQLGDGR